MWHRIARTGTFTVSSRLAHTIRKTRKARRSRPGLIPSVEPLESRLLLSIGPSNVLVIYNQTWAGDQDANGVQDSLQVAQYYAQARGVPAQNLLGVNAGTAFLNSGFETWATTPYTKLYNNLVTPVVNKLNELGKNNIDVLLFCYGINDLVASRDTSPAGRALDTAMAAPFLLTATSGIPEVMNPYFDPAPGFDALRARFNHTDYSISNNSMYLVSRLDGPRGLWDAMEQIDQAQYAQKYLYPAAGYFNGTVYVDNRADNGIYTDAYLQASVNVQKGYYYSYGSADENIAQAEHYLLNYPLPWKWQNTGVVIGDTGAKFTDGTSAEHAPNALFYGGWYGWHNPERIFDWLPGSVADNLISNSMVGLEGNGGTGTQTVKQLGLGLTAGVGTVGEPYVDGHPRPNIMVYYLLQGYSFAEAAMLCTPYLGWMALTVGDPLYTPLDPNKTPTHDTTTPAPASGFDPAAGWWDAGGNYHLKLLIDNSSGPEVARAVVEYGETSGYGQTISCPAFYERPDLTLTGLTPGRAYHMKLTLTDPVGAEWTSGDYVFIVPPKTIYQDTFTASGNVRYKKPTIDSTGAGVKWDQITGTGTETGSSLTVSGNAYVYLPVTTATLQATAGTYTLTANINSTGALDQWVALGFGKSVSSPFANANAIATLCGPASGGSGGVASTYYGTGTGSSGHGVSGTVHGSGVDTISVILITDGLGGATVSFSDSAGLLPQNSGGALTPAQLANINAIFLGSNGTAAGTFSNLTLTFAPADSSSTSVTSSLNPSDYEQSVTFTATVAAGHEGSGTPGGTVTFMDGAAELGTAALNGSGVATFTTLALSIGSHSITAVYGGDADHTGSTSPAITQTVNLGLPGAPGNLAAVPGMNSIVLSWDASSGSVDGYTVERSRDGLTWSTAATLGPSAGNWTDAGISPVPTYMYRLSAYNASGSSAYSNTASANALGVVGDCTGDGKVDIADYTRWFNNYGRNPAVLADGDISGDARIDIADYVLWFNNYGAPSGGTTPSATPSATPGAAPSDKIASANASPASSPLSPAAALSTHLDDDFTVWDFFAQNG